VESFKEAVKLYPYYWPFKLHLSMAYVCLNDLDRALKAVDSCTEQSTEKDITAITLNGRELKKASLPRAEIHILR
jgi:hypothetical protein